jgi:tRNA (guanine37-N1)-methyltransferase
VLVSGHHGEIRRWRKRAALERTIAQRPDLMESAELDAEERELLREITRAKSND